MGCGKKGVEAETWSRSTTGCGKEGFEAEIRRLQRLVHEHAGMLEGGGRGRDLGFRRLGRQAGWYIVYSAACFLHLPINTYMTRSASWAAPTSASRPPSTPS